MSTVVSRTQTTEDDITNEALRRVQGTPDPRTRELMVSLIKHLHMFVKEVQLTEAERAEYEGYVRASKFIAVLKRQARQILASAS